MEMKFAWHTVYHTYSIIHDIWWMDKQDNIYIELK